MHEHEHGATRNPEPEPAGPAPPHPPAHTPRESMSPPFMVLAAVSAYDALWVAHPAGGRS